MFGKKISEKESSESASGETTRLPRGVRFVHTLQGHVRHISRLVWSPDGCFLVSSSADGTVRVWDPGTGECVRKIDNHEHEVRSIAMNQDGHILGCASGYGTVKLWRPASGQRLLSFATENPNIPYGIAFDQIGSTVAMGGQYGIVCWDATTGKLALTLQARDIFCIAFHPNIDIIAAGGNSNFVSLYQLPDGKPLHSIRTRHDRIYEVIFDREGKRLVTVGGQIIDLWDLASGRLLQTYQGHTGYHGAGALSKDQRFLAVKSSSAVHLWDFSGGRLLAALPGSSHWSWPTGVAFHPDGHLLAAVGFDPNPLVDPEYCDRLIHIWELDADLLA